MKHMIRTVIFLFVFGASVSMAGKPQDVIEKSNGYPSGAHFNLNLHGKDVDTFTCDKTPGGNSVFISEYGASTVQYISNKKSSVQELITLDPCVESFDNDPAKVMLPHEEQGYYVFARLRGKPNNGSNNGDPSSVLLYPNDILELCNDDPTNPDPDFPDYTNCLLPLGLLTIRDVYDATPEGFVRFDPIETKGKGKGKAIDITRLFMWSGWVIDSSLDTSGPDAVPDGVIDEYDVPEDYDFDADIDSDDLQLWLQEQAIFGLATYYDNEWVLNIADLVVTEQDIFNDGAKLLKIRFYPVATTEFIQ
jgi:hypothetical protein